MRPTLRKRLLFSLLSLLWASVVLAKIGPARTDAPELPAAADSTSRTDSSAKIDSLPQPASIPLTDSLVRSDSLPLNDSLRPLDSLPRPARRKSNPLEETVIGSQADSMTYDVRKRVLRQYKDAQVKYTDLQMQANQINLDLISKDVEAHGITDTLSGEYVRPKFTEKESDYEVDSLRYNFDSRTALIYNLRTKEGEGILASEMVKKMPDNVMYMKNGRYTTCDADHPHYYLAMTKGVVEPKKKVVFGPAYAVFEDVPFYLLGLPFGFFPQREDRNSGFIIPSFGEETAKGFYLREGGFYFVFSDYLDLSATAGVYTLGSWETNLASSYRKRYKYNGSLGFDLAQDVFGEQGSADYVNQQNLRLRWSHQQDPKFRPNSTFSASVNYSTSQYNKYNATNMNDYLSSQTSSSIAYSKNWMGKPFSLSMNGSHSQSMRDSSMSLSLPTMVFNVTRINPFKRKEAVGKEAWYEKISFTFQTNFTNTAQFKQDEFMTKDMLDKMRYGVQHSLPVSASFNLFNYLNITPGFNYTERWYFRKISQDWDPTLQTVAITDTTNGFYRVYDYTLSLSTSTRLYGNYTLGKRERIKIRHVMIPNASFSYAPDFGSDRFGYYETIQANVDGGTMKYSPYAFEPYGVPGSSQNMSLSFGVGNTLEMKIPSAKDTTGFQKVKLLEAFNISSSYNFLADSLNLQPFSVSMRTTLVKNISLNINATLDPYQIDPATGRRINRFMVNGGGGLARLTSLSTGLSYGFSSKARKSDPATPASNNPENNNNAAIQAAANTPTTQNEFFNQTENTYASALRRAQFQAAQYYDFDIPWSVSFNYNFSFSRPGNIISRVQTVGFNGSINLTSKWAVEFGAGYDLIQRKVTPGTVMIRRDLHCFQATFSWVPIGFRQSWNFSIRAKSSMLADLLKYKKNSGYSDGYYGY